MNLFNSEPDDKLVKLIKNSPQEFRFDSPGLKTRLMANLDTPSPSDRRLGMHAHFLLPYSLIAACMVLLVSGTFAFASTSNPGDALFGINKARERILLSLPLSPTRKAEIETNMVSKRLQALELLPSAGPNEDISVDDITLLTVTESEETLSRVVDNITARKKSYVSEGKTEYAERMNETLSRLENLAKQYEEKMERLESQARDENTRDLIKTHREKINQARNKATLELKILHHDND